MYSYYHVDVSLNHFHLYNFSGILFSHPADFTPVCTSELGRASQLKGEFEKRRTKVIAISVDTVENHKQWINDINDITHSVVDFPIIADTDRRVSVLYGMLDQTHLTTQGEPYTVRSLFIIDPSKIVRLIITYPAPTGRNFNEIIRVLDSLQLAFNYKVATPADWIKGQDTVVLPTVSNEDASKLFPKGMLCRIAGNELHVLICNTNMFDQLYDILFCIGFKEVRPWLRTTPDPSPS